MRFIKTAVHFEMLVIVNVKVGPFAPFGHSCSQIVQGIPELWRRNDFVAYFIEHLNIGCKNLRFWWYMKKLLYLVNGNQKLLVTETQLLIFLKIFFLLRLSKVKLI